jgi:hypothetical protein
MIDNTMAKWKSTNNDSIVKRIDNTMAKWKSTNNDSIDKG